MGYINSYKLLEPRQGEPRLPNKYDLGLSGAIRGY